jgi:hypothetical protein
MLAIVFPDRGRGGTANPSYYMILFANEGPGHEPWLSHTFAAFIKATGTGPDMKKYQLETHAISWLPASQDVRLLRPPERGVNLDLKESLQRGRSLNVRTSMWGPFKIKKELFTRAVRQETRLREGDVAYKALDRRFRPGAATNCFHAISDIDTENGLLDTGLAHGDDATYMVLRHLKRWIIRPQETYDWVARRLGLSKTTIVQRKLQPEDDREPAVSLDN